MLKFEYYMNKILNPPKGIIIKPEVRFGQPTVTGTRIAVADILNLVEAGYGIDDIPIQYPAINLQIAKRAVQYAASILGKEEILTITT